MKQTFKSMIRLTIIPILTILIYVNIGPLIDKLFDDINEIEKKTYYEIIKEIILQLLLICLFWIVIDFVINKFFTIRLMEQYKTINNVLISFLVIGTQKNLIKKINFIIKKYPINLKFNNSSLPILS